MKMRDIAKTDIVAICRGNRENRDLSQRMVQIVILHMPQFTFVLADLNCYMN